MALVAVTDFKNGTDESADFVKLNREDILTAAAQCVCDHREEEYGSPEDNFARIAGLWSAYTGVKFTPKDVGIMMILMKCARAAGDKCTEDTAVDIAGYAACVGELISKPVVPVED